MKAGDPFVAHIVGTVDAVVEKTRGRTVAIIKNSARSYEFVVDGEGDIVSVRAYPAIRDCDPMGHTREGQLVKRLP